MDDLACEVSIFPVWTVAGMLLESCRLVDEVGGLSPKDCNIRTFRAEKQPPTVVQEGMVWSSMWPLLPEVRKPATQTTPQFFSNRSPGEALGLKC